MEEQSKDAAREIADLRLRCERAEKREEFLYSIVMKFHREVEDLDLTGISDAYYESICLYASDWKASVESYIERSSSSK